MGAGLKQVNLLQKEFKEQQKSRRIIIKAYVVHMFMSMTIFIICL